MLANSSSSQYAEQPPTMESRSLGPATGDAAATSDGRQFYEFGFSTEQRGDLRKLLFAFLTDDEVPPQGTRTFDPQTKDGSLTSTETFEDFDDSDWSDTTSEASTTDCVPSDDEYSGDDFSDDDDDAE
jgi:hypothetical protein